MNSFKEFLFGHTKTNSNPLYTSHPLANRDVRIRMLAVQTPGLLGQLTSGVQSALLAAGTELLLSVTVGFAGRLALWFGRSNLFRRALTSLGSGLAVRISRFLGLGGVGAVLETQSETVREVVRATVDQQTREVVLPRLRELVQRPAEPAAQPAAEPLRETANQVLSEPSVQQAVAEAAQQSTSWGWGTWGIIIAVGTAVVGVVAYGSLLAIFSAALDEAVMQPMSEIPMESTDWFTSYGRFLVRAGSYSAGLYTGLKGYIGQRFLAKFGTQAKRADPVEAEEPEVPLLPVRTTPPQQPNLMDEPIDTLVSTDQPPTLVEMFTQAEQKPEPSFGDVYRSTTPSEPASTTLHNPEFTPIRPSQPIAPDPQPQAPGVYQFFVRPTASDSQPALVNVQTDSHIPGLSPDAVQDILAQATSDTEVEALLLEALQNSGT